MSKTEEIYDRYRLNRPIDIVNILYVIFIVSVYCIYMHNMYFDITGTRGKVFTYGSLLYIILFAVSYFLEIMLLNYYGSDKPIFYKDSYVISMPEVWMTLFLIANVFAFFMAPDKGDAWTGDAGRYFGLALVMVIAFSFICLSREASVNSLIYLVFFLVANLAFVLACLQHFGFDPFLLRDRIVDRQKEMFISLFGNINTYGSYICVALPVFVAIFIFGKSILARVLAGTTVFIAGMAIIPAKSDNVYLGLGVAFILLFYIAILNKSLTEYIFSVLLLFSGLESMAILNSVFKGSQKHINGIAKIIENPKVMLIFVLFIVFILLLSLAFRALNYEAYKKFQSKTLLIIFSVILFVAVAGTVIIGLRSGSELFTFNDKWGTFRGYIWRRGISLFKEASPIQKIFGYGNETIGYLMKKNYYAEMVEITDKKYDNLHNELLQYLVTTGIFGLITYLGFVITSFTYIGKRMKGDAVAVGCLAGAVSYFAQSLVTLNQPITTPFFFVILAVGVGYIRYRDQGYGKNNEK